MFVAAIAGIAVLAAAGGRFLATNGDDENRDDAVVPSEPSDAGGPTLGTNAAVDGDPLPSVTLHDVDGNEIDVASLADRPLVLNFWNADCAPCEREMPVLATSASSLDGKVRFVGVNTADTADRARDYANDKGADYLQLLDPNGELVTRVGVGVLPTTLFVDAQGRVVLQKAGELTAAKLDDAVADAFGPVG